MYFIDIIVSAEYNKVCSVLTIVCGGFMVPIYILGMLLRFGPQHGYQIKKLITDNLSDFMQIKLSLVYYHLDKMQKDGFLQGIQDRENNRPEKTVYSVTDLGKVRFSQGLKSLLRMEYRPIFEVDTLFYFSDSMNKADIVEHLNQYAEQLKMQINTIGRHKEESLRLIPDEMKRSAEAVFLHHELHYKAELEWAEQAIASMF